MRWIAILTVVLVLCGMSSSVTLSREVATRELSIRVVGRTLPLELATVDGEPITVEQANELTEAWADPDIDQPFDVKLPDTVDVEFFPVGADCELYLNETKSDIRLTIEDQNHTTVAIANIDGIGTIQEVPRTRKDPKDAIMTRCVSIAKVKVPDSTFFTITNGNTYSRAFSKEEVDTAKGAVEIPASDLRE